LRAWDTLEKEGATDLYQEGYKDWREEGMKKGRGRKLNGQKNNASKLSSFASQIMKFFLQHMKVHTHARFYIHQ